MVGPLFDLLKRDNAKIWKKKHRPIFSTVSYQYCLHELKKTFTTKLVLTQPDENKLFIIETETSEWVIRYSLLQTKDNKPHAMDYDSWKLLHA